MHSRSWRAAGQPLALAVLLLGLAACQAFPPRHLARAHTATVRAGSQAAADSLAQSLDALAPQVRALLPDVRERPLSVWMQRVPTLYSFPHTTLPDADGFYAPATHRIHLRQDAEDLERTLAHELVHASLGESWERLPGTLEEGLCDVVAASLCTGSAARLRAGRLSSACFGLGGMGLELELTLAPGVSAGCGELRLVAQLRLESGARERFDPLDVFRESAGLSSAKLSSHRKKALYGLAGLVVQRIVDRRGLEGLHALCLRAAEQDLERAPVEWFLEAAELDRDARRWREALLEGFGPAELRELVRLHPNFAVDALSEFLAPLARAEDLPHLLPWATARLAVPESGAELDLLTLPEVVGGLCRSSFPESGPESGKKP